MKRLAVLSLLAPLRFYQRAISPLLGPKCRFYPSCSHYAAEAIRTHGAARGFLMGVFRILRCHPWYRGPFTDPVPKRFTWRGLFGYKRASTWKSGKSQ
jgi:putative membrane protein insertion efficiency factor